MKKWIDYSILFLFTALVLCACSQQKESPIEDFKYEMVNGEIIITGYLGTEREIVIPAEINDRPVTQIGEKAFAGYDMTRIELPKSVKIIGQSAFKDCNCLTDVGLPESLERIERWAFDSCDALDNINLPSELQFLGYGSFSQCANLEELVLPDNFTGFDINEVRIVGGSQKEIWSPLGENNGTTVLVVKSDCEALSLILEYGYGKINYIIAGTYSEDQPELDCNERYVLVGCYYEYADRTVNQSYEYDDTGAILRVQNESSSDGDILESQEVYHYNEQGKPDELTMYINGEINAIGALECNENRQVICMRLSNLEGEVYSEIFYAYDENGRQTEVINSQVGSDGSNIKKRMYNENGDILLYENSVYGYTSRKEYIYEKHGELTQIKYTSDTVYQYAEVECDEQGNPTQIIWYDENGEKTGDRTQFSYDSAGNIVKQLGFSNGELQYTATFTYQIVDSTQWQIFGEETKEMYHW